MAPLLRLILLAAALALAGAPPPEAAQTPSAPDDSELKSEEGLRRLLDALETRYETACVRMNEARWRAATSPSDADAAALESARQELAAVFDDPRLSRALAVWSKRQTVTRDPGLSRRVTLWGWTRETAGVELDPNVFAMTSALAARLRDHRFTVDGRKVTRAELDRIIETSPDRDARRNAWMAAGAFAEQVKDDVKKLIRLRAVKAQQTPRRYFHHLVYAGREVDPYWSFGLMEQAARRTRPQYLALLASLKAAVGRETLDPWDLRFALARRTSQRGLDKAIAAAFRSDGAPEPAVRLLPALGFETGSLPVRSETARLGFAGAFGLAVRIPADLRIAVDVRGGVSGPRGCEAVLREYGRALQSAFNRQTSPMLKGYQCVDGARNGVYAEGMAEALAGFIHDPLFLEKHLGMDRGSIRAFLEDETDRALVELRESLLEMGFEFAVYVNPDADLDDRYRVLLDRSLGVNVDASIPVLWPERLALVTSPAESLDRLIAPTIGAEVRARLKEAFGDGRLGSGKAAGWLIERCFADGELVELQTRLSRSINGGMDFEKYVYSLGAARQ